MWSCVVVLQSAQSKSGFGAIVMFIRISGFTYSHEVLYFREGEGYPSVRLILHGTDHSRATKGSARDNVNEGLPGDPVLVVYDG